MNRVLSFLHLHKPSWLSAFGSIVAGGIGVLGANTFQPAPSADWWLWAFYRLVLIASGALSLHGILHLVVLVYRNGLFA